ncbi:MAG: hypothetical protein NZM04_09655 [Methylacidiphilales bacterium]|nr:hypothetical protein [Candidatus Methylacidiphilales bacterium]
MAEGDEAFEGDGGSLGRSDGQRAADDRVEPVRACDCRSRRIADCRGCAGGRLLRLAQGGKYAN